MVAGLILLAVVVLLGFLLVGAYNRLVALPYPASHEDFSASAHTLFRPSRELSNRKYLPSGVQFISTIERG